MEPNPAFLAIVKQYPCFLRTGNVNSVRSLKAEYQPGLDSSVTGNTFAAWKSTSFIGFLQAVFCANTARSESAGCYWKQVPFDDS